MLGGGRGFGVANSLCSVSRQHSAQHKISCAVSLTSFLMLRVVGARLAASALGPAGQRALLSLSSGARGAGGSAMEGVEAKAAQAEAMVATLRERLNTLRALVEKVSALRRADKLVRPGCPAAPFGVCLRFRASAMYRGNRLPSSDVMCLCHATPRTVQCSAVQSTHTPHTLPHVDNAVWFQRRLRARV